jgi:hypothetical protein
VNESSRLRHSVRGLLRDEKDRLLLFRSEGADTGKLFWFSGLPPRRADSTSQPPSRANRTVVPVYLRCVSGRRLLTAALTRRSGVTLVSVGVVRLVVVFRILAALLLAAALAQAVRLGVRRGDWIAIKLLVGFVAVMAAILILAPRLPLGN